MNDWERAKFKHRELKKAGKGTFITAVLATGCLFGALTAFLSLRFLGISVIADDMNGAAFYGALAGFFAIGFGLGVVTVFRLWPKD